MKQIEEIINKQREFFNSRKTININFRIEQLKKLKKLILNNQQEIIDAAKKDLNRPEDETFISEIFLCINEINFALKNIKNWTKLSRVKTPYYLWPSKSYTYAQPYGVTLIISPWNYPFQLTINPLIGAIAAGNCSILKPSEISQNSSKIIYKLFSENFDPEFIAVIEGGIPESEFLLQQKFDYIFFTGSPRVGKIVMKAAAENLTPLTLELGGKNPCIIDETSDLDLASKYIAWGKFLNAGQSCIAPDFLLISEKIKDNFIEKLIFYIKKFYGENSQQNKNYGRIINQKHLARLSELLKEGKIIYGGSFNDKDLYFEPTLIESDTNEEVFGPVLPIISFLDKKNIFDILKHNTKPLAIYLFSKDKKLQKKLIYNTSSGAICFNDLIIQVSNPNLPFGGIGNSGFGKYHGKYSFDAFSNKKAIIYSRNRFNLNFRFSKIFTKLLKKIL
ncbi:aldehyde dehydrogenase [candidate division TM6 bacterium RIFCSPHIGHO2_12_FULL_32_22]|nr:MAG: aldehyde dehydrogenase [candidate division TM6 bacterium RIFCSPHIGHO2_12_FULL_32_22]